MKDNTESFDGFEQALKERDRADRFNEGKRKWSLVDFKSLEPMVEVLEYGEKKYDSWNWMRGQEVTSITDSLLRHTFAFINGEDKDPESELSHLGHMMSNLMFISYMLREKPEFDDRFQKEKRDK